MDAASLDAEPETQDQEYQSVSTDSEKHSAKRQRSTFEEMAARRVQDLEKLKKTVTDGWTEKRKENHTRAIDDLVSKVSKDTEKRNKQAASKSIPKSSVLAQRAAPMKEDHSRRLIYARAAMDYEFEKCINAAGSKWRMEMEERRDKQLFQSCCFGQS